MKDQIWFPRPLAELERDGIVQALRFTGGNKTKAARLLGISLRTLRNKVNEYDLLEFKNEWTGIPRGIARRALAG